jgi:hypothetical protein
MYKVLSPVDKKNGTKYWMRVGSGFPGKDPASFNLYIDAWPNGSKMLHVREMDEEDFQKGRREGPSSEPDLPPASSSEDNDLPF